MEKEYVVVIGGINMDICARSSVPPVFHDSNPGKVSMCPGGVGRNIAHNMSLLGLDVRLMSVFGEDANAELIRKSCAELGIDTSGSLTVPGGTTSTYVFITDQHGEMQLAVSDMGRYDLLNPRHFSQHLNLINGATALVIDTNMPSESIRYLRENVTVPIFADSVSCAKAVKLCGNLSGIHTLKPNILEAEILTETEIKSRADLERAGDILLNAGVKRVFITLGSHGVYAADNNERLLLGSMCLTPVNTTGCGDAFTAALVLDHMEGGSLRSGARCGLAAAWIAMETQDTINSAMCREEIIKRMNLRDGEI